MNIWRKRQNAPIIAVIIASNKQVRCLLKTWRLIAKESSPVCTRTRFEASLSTSKTFERKEAVTAAAASDGSGSERA